MISKTNVTLILYWFVIKIVRAKRSFALIRGVIKHVVKISVCTQMKRIYDVRGPASGADSVTIGRGRPRRK